MTERQFDYPVLLAAALRSLVREILARLARDGLTGQSQPHLTFATTAANVGMPTYLRAQYPGEMTISFGRNRFRDLEVGESGFSVILQFQGRPERLHIPFGAVTSLSDPAEQFVLLLAPPEDGSAKIACLDTQQSPTAIEIPGTLPALTATRETDAAPQCAGEVIALDAFRRR